MELVDATDTAVLWNLYRCTKWEFVVQQPTKCAILQQIIVFLYRAYPRPMHTSFSTILSDCYPALLLSCRIFLQISTPTANCRISTYIMCCYYYYYYYYDITCFFLYIHCWFFPEDGSKRIETCSFKVLIAKLYIAVSCIQLVVVLNNEYCSAGDSSPFMAERMDGAVSLLPLYALKSCTEEVLPLPVTAFLSNCVF